VTVDLRPMTASEYGVWRKAAVESYTQSFVDSAIMTPDKALERAKKDLADLLPDDLATPRHHLWTAWDGSEADGILWVFVNDDTGNKQAFIYDIEVLESQRRRGFGRAIIETLVEWARDEHLESVRLNVFGHNSGAIALYEQLGFEVMSQQMKLLL
jgi:ribosomal protein S18 acetylase RimI-like enzyme